MKQIILIIFFFFSGNDISWTRSMSGPLLNEPQKPVVLTEVPGPQSQKLFQELNNIQVI